MTVTTTFSQPWTDGIHRVIFWFSQTNVDVNSKTSRVRHFENEMALRKSKPISHFSQVNLIFQLNQHPNTLFVF